MTTSQIPLSFSALATELEGDRSGATTAIAHDLAYRKLLIVNVVFIGPEGAGDGNWVLVDTGMPGSAAAIRAAAQARFGQNGRPACIIMTHAHFDHAGALEALTEGWEVPIYAHHAERPFLNGSQSYPPPDPGVGGGLLARLSPLFPTRPANVAHYLYDLPLDHGVPFAPGWKWMHTPGHTPGHISLWRPHDRALIAGDAFVTTRQESIYSSVTQAPEMHGPPMYFTPDWIGAKESVRQLAALAPEIVITGHGAPMQGPEMRAALDTLAADFDRIAVPHSDPSRSGRD